MQARVIGPSDKLTDDEKIELLRGLMSEYATMKVPLAKSKKPLEFFPNGTFNVKYWQDTYRQLGPAARPGDKIQITKITFEGDKLLFDINGGLTSGRRWYDHIQGGMGGTTPVDDPGMNGGMLPTSGTPTSGTYIVVVFGKPMENLTSAEVKKMLAPIMDFDLHSAASLYSDVISPEMKKAIADKRVTVGMTRDQVKMILGQSENHGRDLKDGVETDWMQFGRPPGKITFVTLANNKVIAVKDEYAGLGGDVQ
ncbi:MAG TPA: hypothetical protein VHC90_14065 [Bryobacteraceae bacterium]|nr:hypothetical protein [Bryobacteraceae bacterium]